MGRTELAISGSLLVAAGVGAVGFASPCVVPLLPGYPAGLWAELIAARQRPVRGFETPI